MAVAQQTERRRIGGAKRLLPGHSVGMDAFHRGVREVEVEVGKIVEEILRAAQADAPIETTRLRDSGSADVRTELHGELGRVVGEITFSAFYAAWQHENLNYSHTYGIPGGRSKYLEANVIAKLPEIRPRLQAAWKRGIERG
jgi:hypothetical protein